MSFILKTDAQLEAMTPAERDTYSAEKRAHEKQELNNALGLLKTEVTEAQKSEIEKQIESLKASLGISKEGFAEMVENVKQLKEKSLGGNAPSEDIFALIEKGLVEWLPQVKNKAKSMGNQGWEMELEIKAPVNMTTGAVTTATTVPTMYVAQDMRTYAEDVRGREYILDYLSIGNTSKASIAYMDKSPTEGTMAITAEGALKPLISISYVLRYSAARKMAGRTKISEEAIDDLPFIMSAIRSELTYQHAMGIQNDVFNVVSAFAPAFVAGALAASTQSPSNYDAIRAAIYAVKIASKGMYTPNVVLVPSPDLYAMGATKDKNDQYVFPPFVMPDGSRVSGVRIFEVEDGASVPAGTFIVADWRKLRFENYKTFTVRIGQGIVQSSTAANIVSDFESNMYTLIGESRYHLWIFENEKTAFLKTTFAAVKTAIEIPIETEE